MSKELEELAKKAHRVTQAEQEARIQEIVAALEDAGATGGSVKLEDIASSLYFSGFTSLMPRKSPTFDEEDKRRLAEMWQIIGRLSDLDPTELSAIRELLEERQASSLTKDWYTVDEVAKLTKLRPYTIRQACNFGRIQDDWKKKDVRTGKWRIHRDAIVQIQNEGLPPVSPQRASP